MNMSFDLHLIHKPVSTYQAAMNLYEDSHKINVDVPFNKLILPVPAALIDADELACIFNGERYAATTGGKFFITEETPKAYRRFAGLHELIEHTTPQGFDITGLAKHFQAISIELAYAKLTLPKEEFNDYFEWRKSVERTNYFGLNDDGLVDRLGIRMEEIFKSMPRFLTYRNKQLLQLIEG